jgi:hypothetical protein
LQFAAYFQRKGCKLQVCIFYCFSDFLKYIRFEVGLQIATKVLYRIV